ncbi:hypothetical protein BDK51DRAFT_43644, partial [Blyttiomyces helicus]
AWNKILESSQGGSVHDASDSSCAFEGHHRICKGKNSSDRRIRDYWVNTTLSPIYKGCDAGQNVESASIGWHHPYSRRGSASSVVSSRLRRLSLSSTPVSNANKVVGPIEAQADQFIDSPMEAEEAGTDSQRDAELNSEGHAFPREDVFLDGSTQDGYPAPPAHLISTTSQCPHNTEQQPPGRHDSSQGTKALSPSPTNSAPTRATSTQGPIPLGLGLNAPPTDFNLIPELPEIPELPYQPATHLAINSDPTRTTSTQGPIPLGLDLNALPMDLTCFPSFPTSWLPPS